MIIFEGFIPNFCFLGLGLFGFAYTIDKIVKLYNWIKDNKHALAKQSEWAILQKGKQGKGKGP